MIKLKKTAALLSALLLCGSLFTGVACNKGGDTTGGNPSESSSELFPGNSSEDSSSSEYIPPEPSVFKLEEHTWTDWETVTEKTCTRDGQEKLVCTDKGCGEVKTRTVKAGHVWGDWTGSTDNLCTQSGQLSRVCTECNAKETQTVAARGHTYEDGICKICETPFAFPTLKENPTYTDAWDVSIRGNGSAFDRKELKANVYYTMEIPVTDEEQEDYGVWISVPVSGPGQYALLTIGSANGVAIDRFDASDYYINPDYDTAIEHENGASYSIVNCGTAYWHSTWRATWRFTADTAATVKFVIVRIADEEWAPKSLHETAIPTQINNVTADEPPAGYTAVPVNYDAEYYFDEWNEVYRLGTKENPGEVIYLAIDTAATRLFGEKMFTNIQEDGNNLSFSIGTDEQGNYLIRDYHSFLLAAESTNGNAYENFVNSKGTYPVTQELYEFLRLYTQKNRPIDIPDDVWNNESDREQKAWLAPCYYYRELTPGSEDNPFMITELGDFTANTPKFDIVYFTIAYQDETGAPTSTLILSCSDTNARINVNGTTYTGPFSVEIEVDALTGLTFYIGAKNGAEATFTLSLGVPTSIEN